MQIEKWVEAFSDGLAISGKRPRTIRSYRVELCQFLGFLADHGLEEVHQIQRQDVQAYQVALHRRRKPNGDPITLSTQATKMAAVLAFLDFLQRERHLLLNPARDLELPRPPKPLLPELPSEEEVLRLLEAPDTSTPLGLRDRAILELLYSSALRNTELRQLKLGDVDLQRLEVRVRDGKGGKPRLIPMGEPAAAWLEEYLRRGRGFLLQAHDPGHLFLTFRGGPIRKVGSLSSTVKKHAEAAGLRQRVTPHILRHSCATHMLKRQARLRHLQELLGHASADTTQRYTQVELAELREAHQRFHPRESF